MPARALQSFSEQQKKTGGNWTARRPSPPDGGEAFTHRVPRCARSSRAGCLCRVQGTFSLRLLIEQRFGESSRFSVGIEEEVMILDAETLALTPAVELLIEKSQQLQLPGRLKAELFASIVELNTNTCDGVGAAHEALRELRRAAARISEENGLRIAAAGAHPFSDPEQQ